MPNDTQIRLTWPQVVWGLALIAAVLGAWYDLRYQVREIRVDLLRQETRLSALESTSRNLGFTKHDAEAMKEELTEEIRRNRRAIQSK